MIPYIAIYLIIALLSFSDKIVNTNHKIPLSWSRLQTFIFCVLSLFIGFRHQVGGDWFTYLDHLDRVTWMPLIEVISEKEFGFSFFLWLGALTGYGIYLTNFLSAIVFCSCLMLFCRDQSRPWLALMVSLPYLITIVGMGYARQSVAIGLTMVGVGFLLSGKLGRFFLLILLASSFHRSAIIMLPIPVLRLVWRKWFSNLSLVVLGGWFGIYFYVDTFNDYFKNYVESDYRSSGATLRIILIFVPGVIFLVLRKRFLMPYFTRRIWSAMAMASIALMSAIIVFPSSTAVDRISLYLIPLQIIVLSRIPDAFGWDELSKQILVFLVVGYSGAIMFGWLEYADNSLSWIPYRTVLFY
jgi:hypothetical protein